MASCEVFPSCSLQKKWRVPAWSDRQSLRCKCALLGDFVHQLSAKCHCTHTHSLKPDLVSYKKHNETRRNPWLPPIQVTHPRPESPWYDHWVAESIFFLAGKEVFFRIFRLSCLENLGQTNLEARHRLRPEWRERWMARERLAWNSAAPLPEAWDFTTMAFRLKSFSAFKRKQEETREIPASLT